MTQNNVKFTSINFISEMLHWPYGGSVITDKTPITNASLPITIMNLIKNNYQFARNLIDYQYIKLNYIALKFTNISHYGIQQKHEDGKGVSYPLGVTAINGDMPVYLAWDLEQNLDEITPYKTFGTLLSQYPYSKRWSPSMKYGPTFIFRMPQPYRQYFSCDDFKGVSYSKDLPTFMTELTGFKNIRMPRKLYIGCADWWTNNLPGADLAQTAMKSNIEAKFYLGCTFRGRRLMSGGTSALSNIFEYTDLKEPDIEEIEDEPETQVL